MIGASPTAFKMISILSGQANCSSEEPHMKTQFNYCIFTFQRNEMNKKKKRTRHNVCFGCFFLSTLFLECRFWLSIGFSFDSSLNRFIYNSPFVASSTKGHAQQLALPILTLPGCATREVTFTGHMAKVLFCQETCAFNLTVIAQCRDGNMQIRLLTSEPFVGVVHAYDHDADCFLDGDENVETDFSISLTDFDRCGIQYDWRNERYWVVIMVRRHRKILTDDDKMYNVSCTIGHATNDGHHPSSVNMTFKAALVESGQPTRHVYFGHPYKLKVWSDQQQNDVKFEVLKCAAFAGGNRSLTLYEAESENNLIHPFTYNENEAVAELSSMFRFPGQSAAHLQCTVEFDLQKDKISVEVLKLLAKKVTKPLHTRALASTTVAVLPADQAPEIIEELNCDRFQAVQLALCVALCLLLATGLIADWRIGRCEIHQQSMNSITTVKTDNSSSSSSSHNTGKKWESNRTQSRIAPVISLMLNTPVAVDVPKVPADWRKPTASSMLDTAEETFDSGCDCCSLCDPPKLTIKS
ncbi:hypothetical protein T4A_14473 [Trichinella pseudospiralis]|uniref:Cuticlin N-terminal domain-containing protein n=1 Tax=Trichinella pseudospiralis TaxID=6337 RepID=A0A0V1E6F0_TRIPS|nr:hypothetical protein T4A_14473 [Trichinella pseudospiralis]